MGQINGGDSVNSEHIHNNLSELPRASTETARFINENNSSPLIVAPQYPENNTSPPSPKKDLYECLKNAGEAISMLWDDWTLFFAVLLVMAFFLALLIGGI